MTEFFQLLKCCSRTKLLGFLGKEKNGELGLAGRARDRRPAHRARRRQIDRSDPSNGEQRSNAQEELQAVRAALEADWQFVGTTLRFQS